MKSVGTDLSRPLRDLSRESHIILALKQKQQKFHAINRVLDAINQSLQNT